MNINLKNSLEEKGVNFSKFSEEEEIKYFNKDSNLSTKLPILACWFVNVSKGDESYPSLFYLDKENFTEMEEGNQQPYFKFIQNKDGSPAKLTNIYTADFLFRGTGINYLLEFDEEQSRYRGFYFYIKDDTISNGDKLLDFNIDKISDFIQSISYSSDSKTASPENEKIQKSNEQDGLFLL